MRMWESLLRADLLVLLWFERSRYRPTALAAVRLLSRSGDGYAQVLLPLVILALEPRIGASFCLLVITAFALERPLYLLLKNVLRRPRPRDSVPDFKSIIEASDRFSFPSGHTMAAFVLAGAAATSFGPAALPLYMWAIGVGCSRVALGVHYPSDTLAGALIGSLIIMWLVPAMNMLPQ